MGEGSPLTRIGWLESRLGKRGKDVDLGLGRQTGDIVTGALQRLSQIRFADDVVAREDGGCSVPRDFGGRCQG